MSKIPTRNHANAQKEKMNNPQRNMENSVRRNPKPSRGLVSRSPVVKSAGADSLKIIESSTPADKLNKGGIKIKWQTN